MHKNVLNKLLIISLYCVLFLFPKMTIATNALPELGTVGASALTIEKEKDYGWAFRLMANQSLPIIRDPVLNHYINELGQNLVAHSDSVKLPFNFFLIEDNKINAAAFLGGYVKIHSGLFLYANNESELAGVIAHEIAHITQRHLARMLEQQSFNNPATMAALAGSILLSLVSPAAGMAALSSSMAINMQSQINYTRLHEYEADRIGIKTLYDAGYDPDGMADFFSKLAEKYKYASMPPQMLSTHPLPETRLAEARLRAAQFKSKHIKNNLTYQLSKARITVRYGKMSPATALNFYTNQLKNHKYKLKEAADYGLALAFFQNKSYIESHKIVFELLKKQPNNLFYLDLLTDTSLALNKADAIIKQLSKHYQKSPENAVFALNLANALYINKQYKQAEQIIERFIRHNPKHVLAQMLAIDLYKTMTDRAKEHAAKAQYLALQGRFRDASQEMGSALVYADNKLDQARYSAQIEHYKKDDLRLQALQE